MQTIKYESGIWRIEARLQDVDDSKRMAIVSAVAGEGDDAIESKHTVVFGHIPGCDEIEEAKTFASQVVMRGH
jgi:hypothetical protein